MLDFLRRSWGGLPAIDVKDRDVAGPTVALPSLTGLRGIAAWWVVMYHFREMIPGSDWMLGRTIVDHGYLAVDLFFVLSGFIISLSYSIHFEIFSWGAYARFLGLRLGRIYPLHLFMMVMFLLNPLAIILASHEHSPGSRYGVSYYVMSLLLIQNWGFTRDLAWNVPAWSISVEWFAYLVFPGIVVLERWASTGLRAITGILIALVVLYYSTQLFGDGITENGLIRCLLEFTVGSLVYKITRQQPTVQTYHSEAAVILCFALMTAVITVAIPPYPASALAWSALIFGLSTKNGILSRILSNKIIYRLGEYSYSTYLVHYFVRDWVKFILLRDEPAAVPALIIYLLATAILSFILYRLVEVPGRRFVRGLVDGRHTLGFVRDRTPFG
jgi:peptidoglycan/LPS O-acetylase OafA/YrhL